MAKARMTNEIQFGADFKFQPGQTLLFANGLRLACLQVKDKNFVLQGLQRHQKTYTFLATWRGQELKVVATSGFPGNFGPTRFAFGPTARFWIMPKGEAMFVVNAVDASDEPVTASFNTPMPFSALELGTRFVVDGLPLTYVRQELVNGHLCSVFQAYDRFAINLQAEQSIQVRLPSPSRARQVAAAKQVLVVTAEDPMFTFSWYGGYLLVSQ